MPVKNKESKTVLKKISSQKCCPGHVDCIVDNTAETVRPEGRKSFADVRKHFQGFSCENYFLSQNIPLDKWNAFSITLHTFFMEGESFALNVTKRFHDTF